ncbi:MAG TPA: hypothetical protein VHZ97_14765 [Pseudonocardiaceae bacterium]|nr:hypothetical protein [Pseudonocardiaceae bacterium]
MRRAATVAMAAGIAITTGISSASAASAPTPTSVPLSLAHYGHIVIDPTHRHVFISGGSGSTAIVVTDYTGKTVATIAGEQGAYGLALSTDGRTVYAALTDGKAVSAINTRTLAETARYATGYPTDYVAAAGGRVWFSYSNDTQSGIGSINPRTSAVTVPATTDSWYYAPILAANRDELAAGLTGISPASVATYDVSGGTAKVLAAQQVPGGFVNGPDNLTDLAITPDGADVVTASGYPYYQEEYSATDLTPAGRYTSASYPSSVSIAANGTVFGGVSHDYGPAVFVFAPGNPTAMRSFNLPSDQPGQEDGLDADGLAATPDGRELFAVSSDVYGNNPTLNIIPNP